MANSAIGNLTLQSMYFYNYYVQPQKEYGVNFSVPKPIASSVERSEAPKALGESHLSLPQGNNAAVSDILDNPKKIFFRINEVFID